MKDLLWNLTNMEYATKKKLAIVGGALAAVSVLVVAIVILTRPKIYEYPDPVRYLQGTWNFGAWDRTVYTVRLKEDDTSGRVYAQSGISEQEAVASVEAYAFLLQEKYGFWLSDLANMGGDHTWIMYPQGVSDDALEHRLVLSCGTDASGTYLGFTQGEHLEMVDCPDAYTPGPGSVSLAQGGNTAPSATPTATPGATPTAHAGPAKTVSLPPFGFYFGVGTYQELSGENDKVQIYFLQASDLDTVLDHYTAALSAPAVGLERIQYEEVDGTWYLGYACAEGYEAAELPQNYAYEGEVYSLVIGPAFDDLLPVLVLASPDIKTTYQRSPVQLTAMSDTVKSRYGENIYTRDDIGLDSDAWNASSTEAPTETPASAVTPTVTPTAAPKPAATPAPVSTSKPSSSSSTVPAGTLPDPYTFFEKQIGYSGSKYDDQYWVDIRYKSEDSGAGDEYIRLLQDSRYGLTLIDSERTEHSYDRGMNAYYVFDYSGSASVGDVTVNDHGPASLIIYAMVTYNKKYSDYDYWMTLYYAPDGFTFDDFGDRTTYRDLEKSHYNGKTTGIVDADNFTDYTTEARSGYSGSSSGGIATSDSADLKVRYSCHKCYGTGKVRCTACDGKGYTTTGYSSAPNYKGTDTRYNYSQKTNCSKCHGTGKVDCSNCNGTGKAYY